MSDLVRDTNTLSVGLHKEVPSDPLIKYFMSAFKLIDDECIKYRTAQ